MLAYLSILAELIQAGWNLFQAIKKNMDAAEIGRLQSQMDVVYEKLKAALTPDESQAAIRDLAALDNAVANRMRK